MDPIGIARNIYSIASQIYAQVQQAKANKRQCMRLAERVHITEDAIRGLEDLNKPQYAAGLRDLVDVLEHCLSLIQNFSGDRWFVRLLKAGTHNSEFRGLTEELQKSLQFLNLGLAAQQILNQGQDKADLLEDIVFLQGQQQEIIHLNQENLACVQGIKLQGQEQHEVVLWQLASMKEKLALLLNPLRIGGVASRIENTPRIPYYDLVFEEKIAQGSFATVYRGRWEEQPQAVAIKALSGTLSPQEQELFDREVAIMADLRHPQITTFYGACLEEGHACIVMEYMERGTLREVLDQENLSFERRLSLALDIVRGLSHLHHKNVLHRDLKSANILVNAQGVAKLTDFGLSKTASVYVQTTQERSQALQWQAPECFLRHGEYSEASDVYSFGVILWEIMTGRSPVPPKPEDLRHYASLGRRERIPAEVSPPIAELIQACWAVEPSQRPAARVVVQRLEAYKARPDSPTAEQWFMVGQQAKESENFTEAFKSYKKASDKGHVKANTYLGLFFLRGRGIAKDKSQAYKYLLAGAEGGHSFAMYNLARMFEKGDEIDQDYDQALYWYEKAQAAGDSDAPKKVKLVRDLMVASVGYKLKTMAL